MQNKRKARAALLSVLSNTTLVIIKLSVGLLSGSVSVMSEAIHSGVDLLAALIACVAVHISAKPADAQHTYGHGKVENLSGTIEAVLIFLAAGWIIYEAIYKINKPEPMEQLYLGVVVMGISSLVNWFISKHLMRVGQETDSIALTADAWHLRTDIYTSMGIMVALVIIWGGQILLPAIDFRLIDPIAAIIVALFIIRAACGLTMRASRDLVDVSLPDDEVQWLNNYLHSLAPMVRGVHNLCTRKAGSLRFIEMHVVVAGNMSVTASHAITQDITSNIRKHFVEAHITVHIEPCEQPYPSDACKEHCRHGCLV